MKKKSILVLCAMLTLAMPGFALDVPSVERGKELFTGSQLGTNSSSCVSCHQNGKGLDGIAEYDAAQLGVIVNQCIVKALQGTERDPVSHDMKSLVMYLKTFSHQHQE